MDALTAWNSAKENETISLPDGSGISRNVPNQWFIEFLRILDWHIATSDDWDVKKDQKNAASEQ